MIARLRARRVALVSDWHAIIGRGGPDGDRDDFIWQEFLRELGWLHRQMNPSLRQAAAPLFGLFEMKTIVLCVRNASLGRRDTTDHMLVHSLLSAPLRQVLAARTHASPMVAALAAALAPLSETFRELEARFVDGGLSHFDAALMRLYLHYTTADKIDPDARALLGVFADLRNLMLVYQHLRWQARLPVLLIDGGSLDTAHLRDIVTRMDRVALDDAVATVTGERLPPAGTQRSLETALLAGLTERMRHARQEKNGVALVLDYMWASYVQARMLALLYGRGPDATALERELIW